MEEEMPKLECPLLFRIWLTLVEGKQALAIEAFARALR
jgi:hypothetical protein